MDDVTLTKKICALLGDIDGWEWRETGPAYTSAVVGVCYGRMPASPDRLVAVRVYLTDDNTQNLVSSRRVQLRFRGARGDLDGADALADQAFARLQGLAREGGISGISRLSMTPLGADENDREERSDNYTIILDNPEASS